MKTSETVARLEEKVRPWLTRLPPSVTTRIYSRGRQIFLETFSADRPPGEPSWQGMPTTLWGLQFRLPLLNAAGIFKSGEGYEIVARQGAGGYLGGTTTGLSRPGNRRAGIRWPFAPYPQSGAASNWLGLPNPGHREVASRLRGIARIEGCPLGVSLAASPDAELSRDEKLEGLVAGLRLYDEAGVAFLEINESCPNTEESDSAEGSLAERLGRISEGFLEHRQRRLPVIVKFSCDTPPSQVAGLVDLLVELGFDGVNFGNTSTDYALHRESLAASERRLFDYFTRTFGGGLSGRPLKTRSLELAATAAEYFARRQSDLEFHVIRTGGIETADDLRDSEQAGISLNQWFTGYFAAFAKRGHGVYREITEELYGLCPTGPGSKSRFDS